MTVEINAHKWLGFDPMPEHPEKGLYVTTDLELFDSRECVAYINEEPTLADWKFVVACGYKRIILVPAGMYAQDRFTQDRIKQIMKVPGISLFIEDEGKEIPAYKWLADRHIRAAAGDRNELLKMAHYLDSGEHDPVETWFMVDYWKEISKELDAPFEDAELAYEAYQYQKNLKDGNTILHQSLRKAQDELLLNKIDDAQATIIEGYHQYQKACKAKYKKPIETMAEGWDGFCKEIERWRNRPIIGFHTDMEQLTQSLLGLRGLILIAAEANLGKTILVLQLALQGLKHHQEACCVFLSLEMDRSALYARASASALNQKWVDFIVNGSDEKNVAAKNELSPIMDRIVIVDRDDFDESEEKVLQLAAELRERTGCTRTLIVIDYLQVLEVPIDLERAFRTDQEVDRYRIESMKRLRSALGKDDALLVVSEIRKGASGKGKDKLTNEDLLGSVRLGYAADTILLWQSLTNEEKCQWLGTNFGGVYPREYAKDISGLSKDDLAKEVKTIDDYCKNLNVRPAWLEISKARDGTIRRSIPITAYYNELQILEGFFTRVAVNGADGTSIKTEAKDDEPF